MRNQTSFRLTTTLLPTDKGADHKAKVTQVINKLDAGGNKFYPSFTEETVVITNDDRTIMETTRATTDGNGNITFVKRGLSDDNTATEVANRALTWNPGSIAFVTAGAADWIDVDDDLTWSGKQTYTQGLVSQGDATYKGMLITEKGVQYPSFEDATALEAYESPFGGMFATVDDTGELYRYNAVTEQRDLVSTTELSEYIIRESSTKPSEGTADNIVTLSPEQHGVYLGEDTLVDKDYIEGIAKTQISGLSSIGSFLKTAKAAGTAHNVTISTDTSYTFTGMGYINVGTFYGYALTINGIDIFYDSFSGGVVKEINGISLYTMGPGDTFRIYRPGSQGSISVTVVDYY